MHYYCRNAQFPKCADLRAHGDNKAGSITYHSFSIGQLFTFSDIDVGSRNFKGMSGEINKIESTHCKCQDKDLCCLQLCLCVPAIGHAGDACQMDHIANVSPTDCNNIIQHIQLELKLTKRYSRLNADSCFL